MRVTTGLGILSGLALVGGPGSATTTTATFGVQLQINAECVINSTALLDFGSAGVLGGAAGTSNKDQASTLHVQCTNTTPYDIGLDAGTNAGRSIIWGNTVSTDTVSATGNGATQSYTIYGRVPPQTTPAPATYTDTV